jgi:hypothetical protein
MSNMQSYEALEADYGTDTFRRSEPIKASRQQQSSSHSHRRAKGPQSVNGIHRRRRRKINW